jgi:hypothetical protein
MQQTTKMMLAMVFVMGMTVLPGHALTADTGMGKSGSTMIKEESSMPGDMVDEKAEEMKEEKKGKMASGMPEPMTGEMEKDMDSGEMHQQPTEETSKEREAMEGGGKKIMK